MEHEEPLDEDEALVAGVLGRKWREALHPRGRDGRWIKKKGFVKGFFNWTDGKDPRKSGRKKLARAKVLGFSSDFDASTDDPWVVVKYDGRNPDMAGAIGYARASEITPAADIKAKLKDVPRETPKMDRQLRVTRMLLDDLKAMGIEASADPTPADRLRATVHTASVAVAGEPVPYEVALQESVNLRLRRMADEIFEQQRPAREAAVLKRIRDLHREAVSRVTPQPAVAAAPRMFDEDKHERDATGKFSAKPSSRRREKGSSFSSRAKARQKEREAEALAEEEAKRAEREAQRNRVRQERDRQQANHHGILQSLQPRVTPLREGVDWGNESFSVRGPRAKGMYPKPVVEAMAKASEGVQPTGADNVSDAIKAVESMSDADLQAHVAKLPVEDPELKRQMLATLRSKYSKVRLRVDENEAGWFLDDAGVLWAF